MTQYIVIRKRDKKHFSIPAEYPIAEGIKEYLDREFPVKVSKYTIVESPQSEEFPAEWMKAVSDVYREVMA